MTQFRRSHGKDNGKAGMNGKFFISLILFGLVLAGMYYLNTKKNDAYPNESKNEDIFFGNEGIDSIGSSKRFFLPSSTTGEIIHHKYYSLSYNEKYEEAEWVAYILTQENLKIKNVKRYDRFNPDIKVPSRSAIYDDYTASGYTRGHLVPSGDMAFSLEANKESFLMSNITPQIKQFNDGIWNELEQDVRDWAWSNHKIYVVTGPVLNGQISQFIGHNQVGVPNYFYKIVLDYEGNDKKAIGFIIPNQKSIKSLSYYAVTIDSIEKITGIDFFANLLTKNVQNELESKIDVQKWYFNPDYFDKRLNEGNRD